MASGVGAAGGGGTWWQDLGPEGQEQFRQDNPSRDDGGTVMYHNGVPVSGVWEPGNMEDRARFDPKGVAALTQQISDFDAWKIQSGYADGIDPLTNKEREYGGWTAWQLFHQVQRAGGTADPYDPFLGPTTDTVQNGVVTVGPVTASDDADVRADMQNAFYFALREAGMDKAAIDSLWAWAETELVNDPSFNAERALLGMYDSEAFRQRFRGIAELSDKGVGRRDLPTPAEYIAFEKYVAKELSRVGIIETNFDDLITKLYVNTVGDTEVTERLNMAQQVMWEMPQEVRDTFTDWFGSEYGTSITMKTFLDNTGDWSKIQDDISTARTGGWGHMVAGLNAGWDKDLAKQVSDLGLTQAEQWSRFADLKEKEMLFAENIDEAVDLDYAEHGVAAEFDLDIDLAEIIDRRATGRSARFSGAGGALMSGTTTGFGAANA